MPFRFLKRAVGFPPEVTVVDRVMGPTASPEKVEYYPEPSAEVLGRAEIAGGLGRDFAYQPDAVRSTLIGMARMEEGSLTVALVENQVVGFLFLTLPHPESRWGRAMLPWLYEVATLEVARAWRGQGVATGLLKAAVTPGCEERIVLAPLDPEEWDVLGTGLSKTAYRQMLLSLFRSVGFAEYPLSLDVGLSHDPSSLFLVRVGARVDRQRLRQFEALLGTAESRSLLHINQLPREEREAIYRRLIPEAVFTTCGIDAGTFTDRAGNRLVEFNGPPDQDMIWIGVRGHAGDTDWCYLLKLQATAYGEIELAFVIISDPRSERYCIDRDPEGRSTHLGTTGRNIPEEIRAMQAGFTPGQTRRGLRLLREAIQLVEDFIGGMGHGLFLLDAMFYHNAILYERYGFGYVAGREAMEEIHREFQPGGVLDARLDGSTPFRQPGMGETVRGRSWAIHDGILGGPWPAPRMVKRVGQHEGISTFPESRW